MDVLDKRPRRVGGVETFATAVWHQRSHYLQIWGESMACAACEHFTIDLRVLHCNRGGWIVSENCSLAATHASTSIWVTALEPQYCCVWLDRPSYLNRLWTRRPDERQLPLSNTEVRRGH